MHEDEHHPKKAGPPHEVGEDLSLFSIAEIDDRVAVMRNEIMRLETAKVQKLAAQEAAGTFFKR